MAVFCAQLLWSCASGPGAPLPAQRPSTVAPGTSPTLALRERASQHRAAYLRTGAQAELEAAIASFRELATTAGAERTDQLGLAELLLEHAALVALTKPIPQDAIASDLQASLAAAKSALNEAGQESLAKLEQGQAPAAPISSDATDLEALYRVALATLLSAELEDHVRRLQAHALARVLLEHCAATAPELDGGGPDRVLGQLDARPAFAEQRDLAAAKSRLERAIARAPDDARNHLDYARHYAITAQDRPAFERAIASARRTTEATPRAARARSQTELLGSRIGELFE